ncbi:MAG: histidinol-phosphate transaminase [Actinobacteria bacterium]|nr:histidinol-phosphate transaminase [Actinomycetota bacterium]
MTRVRLRATLDGIPSYLPGQPPPLRPGVPAYKLSSNENPYPPLPGVLAAATAAAGTMNRYPDMFATELVAGIAKRYEVPEEHVVAGTGSVGVLQQIVQATAGDGDEVLYAWRSFEAYPIVTRISGARPVQVPLTADERHDLTAMARAVTDRTRLILLCSPNNPTGPVLRHDELTDFLDRVPEDVLVVVDEAYTEFVRDPLAADGLATYRSRPNVAVLRTFSKAFGLAGLRVGFAIAQEEVADALRKASVPFGVSVIAQHAAVASLHAEAALAERVRALVEERERVVGALRDQGWTVPETEANFVWLRLGDRSGAFAAACEEVGIMVRSYGTEGVRVTIGEPAANDLLLRTGQAWRSG